MILSSLRGLTDLCAVQICVSGWSMGAIHACMIASLTRFPVATAALLPPRCASTAYCDGALSEFVDLAALRSARDEHGVPVLETTAVAFTQMPNYPNSPKLFQHLRNVSHAAEVAGSVALGSATLPHQGNGGGLIAGPGSMPGKVRACAAVHGEQTLVCLFVTTGEAE